MPRYTSSDWMNPDAQLAWENGSDGADLYHKVGGTWVKDGSAEQAKATGGMLALYPSPEFAQMLAIPGGEPVEDLHVTVLYFGEDVGDRPGANQDIANAVHWVAGACALIEARVFAHAMFNPDGANGHEPCAVYLVGSSKELSDFHDGVKRAVEPIWDMSEQHSPWIPHLTLGYSLDPSELTYTGPITFDRAELRWMGNSYVFPFEEINSE